MRLVLLRPLSVALAESCLWVIQVGRKLGFLVSKCCRLELCFNETGAPKASTKTELRF